MDYYETTPHGTITVDEGSETVVARRNGTDATREFTGPSSISRARSWLAGN